MKRIDINPRLRWQDAVEKLGFGFHTTHVPYWDETAYYSFTLAEIEAIEKATEELWRLCLAAVQYVTDNNLYKLFKIPEQYFLLIKKSWEQDHPSIYGRFDLAFANGKIKLLEFNADTPTSLYEAGIVQWFWLQDFDNSKDQFNSIHEKLIAYWKEVKPYLKNGALYFSCVNESLEDFTNVEYLRDCAMQAGLETKHLFINEIGWNERLKIFTDLNNKPIKNIFKLYPWEWMVNEEFGSKILDDNDQTFWIEPIWKMILSNKAILAVLWKLNPGHPLLLPAYFDKHDMDNFVKKPLLSREGANIEIVSSGTLLQSSEGEYGEEGFVYQQYFQLPEFNNNHPIMGSWIIGEEPAGIGIRESDKLITDNFSRFVPHLIE